MQDIPVEQHHERMNRTLCSAEGWAYIAATAWNGYRQVDRGFVVVDFATPAHNKSIISYQTFREHEPLQHPAAVELFKFVTGYDPERAVVVVFLFYDGKQAYRYQHFAVPYPGLHFPPAYAHHEHGQICTGNMLDPEFWAGVGPAK